MPSEKSKYLNIGPPSLLNIDQLKNNLSSFTKEHLIEIIWLSAQTNSALWKALNAHIGIKFANGDWEKAKIAIDDALDFNDFAGYSERGHDIILYEIMGAIEILHENGDKKFALHAAEYIIESGEKVLEYFDDGWGWLCALKELEEWVVNNKAK